jgi:hypothetical protein
MSRSRAIARCAVDRTHARGQRHSAVAAPEAASARDRTCVRHSFQTTSESGSEQEGQQRADREEQPADAVSHGAVVPWPVARVSCVSTMPARPSRQAEEWLRAEDLTSSSSARDMAVRSKQPSRTLLTDWHANLHLQRGNIPSTLTCKATLATAVATSATARRPRQRACTRSTGRPRMPRRQKDIEPNVGLSVRLSVLW